MHRWMVRVCPCVLLFGLAAPLYGQTASGPEDLTGENAAPLQITGFGVADYNADGRTRENAFGAGKLAVSLFREASEHLWFFGQLTTTVARAKEASAE